MKFLADENFHNDVLRGLLRRLPSLDIVRAQDVGLGGASDPEVLAWAADQGCVLLTHDVATITKHAYERAVAGGSMPGVIEVPAVLRVRDAIDDLILIATLSVEGEYEGQVRYLPLK